MKESNLQKEIQIALTECGARVFRNNIGRFRDPKGNWVRFGVGGKGGSDLIGFSGSGRFIAVEVKRPGQRGSKEQILFLNAVTNAGGIAICAVTVDQVVRDYYRENNIGD